MAKPQFLRLTRLRQGFGVASTAAATAFRIRVSHSDTATARTQATSSMMHNNLRVLEQPFRQRKKMK
jgi:hypothetical protein